MGSNEPKSKANEPLFEQQKQPQCNPTSEGLGRIVCMQPYPYLTKIDLWLKQGTITVMNRNLTRNIYTLTKLNLSTSMKFLTKYNKFSAKKPYKLK